MFIILLLILTDPSPPVWEKKYHVEFIFSLPYAKLHQPIVVDYDELLDREVINHYNGLAIELWRYDDPQINNYFEIIVTQNNYTCFPNPGEHLNPPPGEKKDLVKVLPDLSNWNYKGQTVVRGNQVDYWQFINVIKDYNRSNEYRFFTQVDTGIPIQYWMMGYDTVFGSHYDEYILDYYVYKPNEVNEDSFNVPSICPLNSSLLESSNNHIFERNIKKLKNLFPLIEEGKDIFNKFIKKFDKKYSSNKEFNYRKQVYLKNLEFINSFNNKESSDLILKPNKFSDLSFKEFSKFYLQKSRKVQNRIGDFNSIGLNLPEKFDWREHGAVSNVKDQATCGSCWAFSTVGSLEGARFLSTGKMVTLSEQNIIDCTWNVPDYIKSYGCDGSDQWKAMEALIILGGIMTEEDYPYLSVTGYCAFDNNKKASTISYYRNVTSSEQAVMEALYTMGPLSVSYDVTEANVWYSGGYFVDNTCSNTSLNHAVTLVGFGDYNGDPDKPYWLVKNSWSTHWGDNGYFYISRKKDCGISTEALFPVLKR